VDGHEALTIVEAEGLAQLKRQVGLWVDEVLVALPSAARPLDRRGCEPEGALAVELGRPARPQQAVVPELAQLRSRAGERVEVR
jgi:hypothetical protein